MPRRGPGPTGRRQLSGTDEISGQTLIEVMIASALLAVLFVALFGAFDTMLAMNRLSSDVTRATLDADGVMADLEATSFDLLRDYTPPTLDGLPEESTTVSITTEDGEAIPDEDPLPGVVRVAVTIGWTDGGGIPQEVTLYTLRGGYQR